MLSQIGQLKYNLQSYCGAPLKSNIFIRQARLDEISWVNNQYEQIGFKPSDFNNELIAIAEVNGEKAGPGRLQYIEENVAELGGMYVKDDFRGYGIASQIVEFLIKNSTPYNRIYCLPFSHLEKFYQNFGFNTVSATVNIPDKIMNKHSWCNSTYEHTTLLFVLNK